MSAHDEAVEVRVGRLAMGPKTPPSQSAPSEPKSGRAASAPLLTPPIDIYESHDGLILEADLPGVSDQHLTIQLEDNVLNLRGNVVSALPAEAKVIHEEYRPGDFGRSFILSDEVDRARITASLKDGVLKVVLPKAERSRTRKIEIKTS